MGRVPTIYHCTYADCTASFNRKQRFETHLRSHTGERPFYCSHENCGKNFGSLSHLRRHEDTHESSYSFRCKEENCYAILKSKATLKKHIKVVHLKIKKHKVYTCTQCGKDFSKHNMLQRHELRHSGQLPYKCSVEDCEKAFLTPSKLKRHMKVHDGYPCKVPDCGEIFYKWSLYVQHVKESHPPEHKCQLCSKVLATFTSLKLHIQLHEEPRAVYPCQVPNCSRYYYAERNLKWHVKKYHEKRKFKCKKKNCPKAFKTEADLADHILYHGKKKPRKRKKPKKPKPSLAAILSGYAELTQVNRKPQNPTEEIAEPSLLVSSSNSNLTDLESDTIKVSFAHGSEPDVSTIMEEDNFSALSNEKNRGCTKSFKALSLQNICESSQSYIPSDMNTFSSNCNNGSTMDSKKELYQASIAEELDSVVCPKNNIVPMEHETNYSFTNLEASESTVQKYNTIELVRSENLSQLTSLPVIKADTKSFETCMQNLFESIQLNTSRDTGACSSNINSGSTVESEVETNQLATTHELNSIVCSAKNYIALMEQESNNSVKELEALDSAVQQYTAIEVINSENISQLIYVPVIKIDNESWNNNNVMHIETVS